MIRNITCILCPRGCTMTADVTGETVTVRGNTCPRGEAYAVQECTHPMRTVTGSVFTEKGRISVKTSRPVPKEAMGDVMAVIHSLRPAVPVAMGQILAENVFGAEIVVTSETV